jgi:hypothetical protein
VPPPWPARGSPLDPEELALREGKSQQYISQRLRFGRFLSFSENSPYRRIISEWNFREYWQRSEGRHERQRFRHIAEMIETDAKTPKVRNANSLMDAIRFGASSSDDVPYWLPWGRLRVLSNCPPQFPRDTTKTPKIRPQFPRGG